MTLALQWIACGACVLAAFFSFGLHVHNCTLDEAVNSEDRRDWHFYLAALLLIIGVGIRP